jgi:hypothetical protein
LRQGWSGVGFSLKSIQVRFLQKFKGMWLNLEEV